MPRMLPKKSVWLIGAELNAFPRWLKFAPNPIHVMNRPGKAARTAAVKTSESILGGERGSSRNMWWISGSAEYRAATGAAGVGEAVGAVIVKEKAVDFNAFEDPKLPITIEAWSGFLDEVSAVGISAYF
jgi:hypothetical protein